MPPVVSLSATITGMTLKSQTQGVPGMKFAAFTTVAGSAGEAANAEQLMDNLRQQTILAEELGFEAMWLGEHHFGPYGGGRSAEPDPAGSGPGGEDVEDPDRTDGQHSPVVASDTAGRRPGDAGQHDPGTRGSRVRQGDLAV